MGILKHFDLKKFDVECFLETGTENGHGIDHALKYNFKSINSVEINHMFYRAACIKYAPESKVHLWHGSSEECMPDMLKSIKSFKSCFFWLDAHLPSDPGSKFLYERKNDNIEFPLEQELKNIISLRNIKNDVFLIDDLRIYIDGPFEHAANTWPYRNNYPNFFPHKDGISFIKKMFIDTHNINNIYDHEGYLLLTPK